MIVTLVNNTNSNISVLSYYTDSTDNSYTSFQQNDNSKTRPVIGAGKNSDIPVAGSIKKNIYIGIWHESSEGSPSGWAVVDTKNNIISSGGSYSLKSEKDHFSVISAPMTLAKIMWFILITVIALIILAGLGFFLYYIFYKNRVMMRPQQQYF